MQCEIKTDRLLLRPLDISDFETVHAYASDIESTRYMIYLPHKTKEETYRFLVSATEEWKKEKPSFYEFAVVFNGVHIGAVSLYLDDTGQVGELGWIINKKYWKNGFATEAALAIKDFAIKTIKVKKLVAHCDNRNVNSYKLMSRIGLRLEDDSGTRTYTQTNETAKELKYSFLSD